MSITKAHERLARECDRLHGINAELVAALKEAQRYQLQLGIPSQWGRDVLAQIDAALRKAGAAP